MAGKSEKPGAKGAKSYDAFKTFHGRRYQGMKIGRGHTWNYEPGVWTEKKVTPEKWEVDFAVKKHRKGRAPEGSGAPVGTSHHWFILADQVVTKLDANAYSTDLHGVKYMLAYEKAGTGKWSAGERARRNHLIKILRAMIAELEAEAEAPPEAQPAAEAAPRSSPKPRQRAARPTDEARARRRKAA